MASIEAMQDAAKRINNGNLSDAEAMLYSQATSLNMLFAELNRLSFLNLNASHLEACKVFMGLALKAQNQARMTLESLGNIKNPPTVFAKQANIAHGPQQVNNSVAPRAPATEIQNPPSKLLEQSNEQPMDTGTQSQAGGDNSKLETVDAINRSKVA